MVNGRAAILRDRRIQCRNAGVVRIWAQKDALSHCGSGELSGGNQAEEWIGYLAVQIGSQSLVAWIELIELQTDGQPRSFVTCLTRLYEPPSRQLALHAEVPLLRVGVGQILSVHDRDALAQLHNIGRRG